MSVNREQIVLKRLDAVGRDETQPLRLIKNGFVRVLDKLDGTGCGPQCPHAVQWEALEDSTWRALDRLDFHKDRVPAGMKRKCLRVQRRARSFAGQKESDRQQHEHRYAVRHPGGVALKRLGWVQFSCGDCNFHIFNAVTGACETEDRCAQSLVARVLEPAPQITERASRPGHRASKPKPSELPASAAARD